MENQFNKLIHFIQHKNSDLVMRQLLQLLPLELPATMGKRQYIATKNASRE